VSRRGLILIGLTMCLVVGIGPAWAGFSDSASVGTTVSTDEVAPPQSINVNSSCQAGQISVDISWQASKSQRVSGYTVTAYLDKTSTVHVATTDAATTATSWTWTATPGTSYEFTVTTLTEYGWTAESPKTQAVTC
jgi:hypothetical protein